MKGLILCGGRGTRLRPFSFSQPKHLLPMGNRPVVWYAIQNMVQAGIRDIGLVVPPHFQSLFESCIGYGDNSHRITYIQQQVPNGIADAVVSAREFLGNEPFLVFLGDNYYGGSFEDLVNQYEISHPDALLCVSEVEDPRHYGVCHLHGNIVVRVEEKPKTSTSSYAIVGVYLFSSAMLHVITQLRPSTRGEYEITDAIQMLIDRGLPVLAAKSTVWWKDTGSPDAFIECNRKVLQHLRREISPEAFIRSSVIRGSVNVDPAVEIVNSVIEGPVVVGAGARLHNAYVGPSTSIANDVEIVNSSVSGSVILEGARIHDLRVSIRDSIVGAHTYLERGETQSEPSLTVFIGDYSKMFI